MAYSGVDESEDGKIVITGVESDALNRREQGLNGKRSSQEYTEQEAVNGLEEVKW